MAPLIVRVVVASVAMVAPAAPKVIAFDQVLLPAMFRIAPIFPQPTQPVPISELMVSAMVKLPKVPSICKVVPVATLVWPASPPRAELFFTVRTPALIVVVPV